MWRGIDKDGGMVGVSHYFLYLLASSDIPGKATKFNFSSLYFGVIGSAFIFWWEECLESYVTLGRERVRKSCWV